jgi:hypothetical protein
MIRNKFKFFLILFLVILIGSLGYIAQAGYYPIALVNTLPIHYVDFKKDLKAGLVYYNQFSEIYNKKGQNIIKDKKEDSAIIEKELQKAVLDTLIENILIDEGLRQRMKKKEINDLVNEKIEKALIGVNIKDLANKMYGLSADDFIDNFLRPQAKRDILSNRLNFENTNLNDWLKNEKKRAKVIILLSNFQWNGDGVQVKK